MSTHFHPIKAGLELRGIKDRSILANALFLVCNQYKLSVKSFVPRLNYANICPAQIFLTAFFRFSTCSELRGGEL